MNLIKLTDFIVKDSETGIFNYIIASGEMKKALASNKGKRITLDWADVTNVTDPAIEVMWSHRLLGFYIAHVGISSDLMNNIIAKYSGLLDKNRELKAHFNEIHGEY